MQVGSRSINARLYAVAGAAFAILVICMWAWYGLHSGMGYETHFPLQSESTDRGRHFGIDMRRFTSMFYHLAYVIGSWTGHPGSYVPYQIVYAGLWLVRGLLVFHLVRMLGDSRGIVAILAGAFTVLHAADLSLNWVGQLNQFGFIIWMLLAFAVLLKAFEFEHRLLVAIPLAVLATQLARLCIYSYESPLPLIFGFPLLAIALFLGWSRRKLLLLAVFYSLPLQYCWRWLRISVDRRTDADYQFSVLRQDWSALSIVGDWAQNTWHSVAFWQWFPALPLAGVDAGFFVVATICSVIASMTLVLALAWFWRLRDATGVDSRPTVELRLLALGLAMAILSFPAYLLLDTATSHWRTQLLAGPGAGIAWAALLVIVAGWFKNRPNIAAAVTAICAAAIAVAATWAGQAHALRHRLQWEQHRNLLASVLTAAPNVADGTLMLLINRRDEPLVFGENVWWDYGVRLAYPGRKVAGAYFERSLKEAPGVTVRFAGPVVRLESNLAQMFPEAAIGQLLVLEAFSDNRVHIAQALPDWLPVESRFRQLYRPQALVGPWPPDERALRRFGPIERR